MDVGSKQSGRSTAFVTPDSRGSIQRDVLLSDERFATALDEFVPDDVRILCINDCCNSGTICNIDCFDYRHEIYQISAAQDDEEAEETEPGGPEVLTRLMGSFGKGGVLSTAIRRSVRELSMKYGANEFGIQDVFKKSKRYARRMTDEQELSFQFSGTNPDMVAWPMSFPWWEY